MLALIVWLMTHRMDCAGQEGADWYQCEHDRGVVNLGKWDARPNAREWPDNADVDAPKAWGEYATEKRD